MRSTIKVVAAFEEADNRYNEDWPRSQVVEFLQNDYGFTTPEATAIAIAVENTRVSAVLKVSTSAMARLKRRQS